MVEILARHSGVPVYNGLTDDDHPTQIIADFMTMEEHIAKPLSRQKLVFVGDVRNNMCYALMYGCCKIGVGHRVVSFGIFVFRIGKGKPMIAMCRIRAVIRIELFAK